MSHRDFNVSGFWSLQTWFNSDHTVSCSPDPNQFMYVTLEFFAVDNGNKATMMRQLATVMPAGRGGSTRADRENCRELRVSNARIVDARVVVIVCTRKGHSLIGRGRSGCRMGRIRLRQLPRPSGVR